VGHPRFQPYAVRSGDKIVAGANLFIAGDVASLNAARRRRSSGAAAPRPRSSTPGSKPPGPTADGVRGDYSHAPVSHRPNLAPAAPRGRSSRMN
jgi:hypothetical protein